MPNADPNKFNWGSANWDSGHVSVGGGADDSTYRGSLMKLGESMNDAIDQIGGKMNDIMSQLADDPSNPQLLGQYQQIYLAWVQASNLQANAVSKMAKLDDQLIQIA